MATSESPATPDASRRPVRSLVLALVIFTAGILAVLASFQFYRADFPTVGAAAGAAGADGPTAAGDNSTAPTDGLPSEIADIEAQLKRQEAKILIAKAAVMQAEERAARQKAERAELRMMRSEARRVRLSISERPPGPGLLPASVDEPEPEPELVEPALRMINAAPGDALGKPTVVTNVLTWNYWLDDGSASIEPAVYAGPLDIGVERKLTFRLSSFDLGNAIPLVKSMASAPELLLAIKDGLSDDKRKSIDLDILVSSVDELRVKIAPQSRKIALQIDLDAMRAAQADQSLQWSPNRELSEAFLKATTITNFDVSLTPLMTGTHEIAINMIDAVSGFPLQSMIVRLAVDKPWPTNVTAELSGQAVHSKSSPPVDLILVLTDLESVVKGVIKRDLEATLSHRDPATGRYSHVSWRPGLDLAGLIDNFKTFQSTVGSVSSGTELLEAGYDAGLMLFEPIAVNGECELDLNCINARQAREIIVKRATYPKDALPPSMSVKIVRSRTTQANAKYRTKEYASEVFPIGALGISTSTRDDAVFLGERFSLALILGEQQPDAGATCPAQWYVALPDDKALTTQLDQVALKAALTGLTPSDGFPVLNAARRPQSLDLDALKNWFFDKKSADNPHEPVVFAFIGHHDEGRLFLKQDSIGIQPGRMRRDFKGSSIVILDACNSAMTKVSAGTPVGRLAMLNVATTIATTSKISGELAAAYLVCLNAQLSKHGSLTVGQAHALATKCLWAPDPTPESTLHYTYEGAALKYVLIGNPHQRICAPAMETK